MTMPSLEFAILVAVFLPMFGVAFLALAGGRLGSRIGWAALPFPMISFLAVLYLWWAADTTSATVEWSWISALGIHLSFLIDGHSLFYAMVVSGIGILIFYYAIHYFGPNAADMPKFYASITLFMAAMLGTVFSNNLISLFMFWEMTGIASFLLIGFSHEKDASRVGARMALLITIMTGFFLMAGFIMLSQSAGTMRIDELMTGGLDFQDPANKVWLNAATVLILLGAFGKSAQFPFHFWLPNAMAAPTPVSAYLHSATMVKLGVFLCGRTYPFLSEAQVWLPLLGVIGFGTMCLAAYLALCSTDLKSILAYSTVSALGFFIGYYGLGSAIGVKYDLVHILAHVLFKAALFMTVGIIDHATGIRDIRQLGGLRRRLPLAAAVCAISAASMAGLPFTLGFIGKELMLADLLQAVDRGGIAWFFAALILTATVLKFAFAARLFFHVFTGPEPEAVGAHYHDPGRPVHYPALLLTALTVIFGCVPSLLNTPLDHLFVPGLQANPTANLYLWHGFNAELGISAALVVLGVLLYLFLNRRAWTPAAAPHWIQFDRAWEPMLYAFNKFTIRITNLSRGNQPMDYLPIVAGSMVLCVGAFLGVYFWQYGFHRLDMPVFHSLEFHFLRIFSGILIILAVIGVLFLRRWTAQLISLSAAGFLITFYYVLYRAPDLAMTQILVEAATLLLILILLGRFPRSAELGEEADRRLTRRQVVSFFIAIGSGIMVTLLMIVVLLEAHEEPIGPAFLDITVSMAGGSNAVNTILVDFRGLDTLGEIAVLLIAVLGGIGLLMRYKRTASERAAGPLGAPGMGAERTMNKDDAAMNRFREDTP